MAMTPLAVLVSVMPQDVKKEASDYGFTVPLQFQCTERLKGGTMWGLGFYINNTWAFGQAQELTRVKEE